MSAAQWLMVRVAILATGLLALLILALLVIAGLPRGVYNLDEVRAGLFTPPADCPTPCWAGIQPGVTPWEEALTILEAHPWIGVVDNQLRPEHVDEPNLEQGTIFWLWSGRQPDWLTTETRSRIEVRDGRVVAITFYTRLPLADVWLAAGPPENAILLPEAYVVSSAARAPVRYFQGNYTTPGVTVTAEWPCPLNAHERWWQPVTVSLTTDTPRDAPGSVWDVRPVCE